jgi:hypothetical protein
MKKILLVTVCLFYVSTANLAFAWHDKTHIAIANSAGYENWFNVAGADITKTKAGDIEAKNHWFNNNAGVEITGKMVLEHATRYNDPKDDEGHLYGAIIASLRDYMKDKQAGKYAEYNMALCAHYIGDLSMPMHNAHYKGILATNHTVNDSTIESSVMNSIGFIQRGMSVIKITSEEDLAKEIARIANGSRQLALKLEAENRDMTKEEGYAQAIQSASLLKATLAYTAANK